MDFLNQLAQSYYYSYSTPHDEEAVWAALFGSAIIIGFALIFALIAYIVTSFLLSRIFKKAGVEGWKAWVPIYNVWILLELGGQQGFWAILALIPVVNIASAVFVYIAMYNIGLKLQKEGWFVILGIFIPIVWYAWLAFDSSTWQDSSKVVKTGIDTTEPVATEGTEQK